MKEKGLLLNTPVFHLPVCAQVSCYLRNVNYVVWAEALSVLLQGIECNYYPPPHTHTHLICLFSPEVLCEYRVRGRWGLTWINKGLESRGGSDVTCPANANKKKCTAAPDQKHSCFSCLFLTDIIMKTEWCRLESQQDPRQTKQNPLCKAAEKDLKDLIN